MSSAHLLVGDLAARARTVGGNKVAIAADRGSLTYAELADGVDALAAHLLAGGLRPGERLALVAPNRPEVVQTILAASLIGVTVVPMNLRLRPDDLRFQADDAQVAFTVVDPVMDQLARAGGLLDRPHWTIGEDLGRVEPEDRARLRAARPAADSVLIQLYTSGTTGRPKGCLLTQQAWLAATASLAHMVGLRDTDVLATPLPFFHVAGLDFALATLAAGATLALPAGPTPADAWTAVDRHGVTIVQTLGSYRSLLAAAPDGLQTVRGVYGLASWSDELDALGPEFGVWTGYGSTELCGLAVGHGREGVRARPGAIGRPMLGYASLIADPDGHPVPAGEIGELLMRGPSVTSGYWNLPEATAEALRDGWFHTGDLVQADEDGCLRFVDRVKDMVKPGGENVYCVEVEEALGAHPAVRECAVIGVPDERWGEAVKAVLVLGEPTTVEALDAWCLDRLAAYKRPRWYEFVDALPRNALTKVQKTELRAHHDPAACTRLPERAG